MWDVVDEVMRWDVWWVVRWGDVKCVGFGGVAPGV